MGDGKRPHYEKNAANRFDLDGHSNFDSNSRKHVFFFAPAILWIDLRIFFFLHAKFWSNLLFLWIAFALVVCSKYKVILVLKVWRLFFFFSFLLFKNKLCFVSHSLDQNRVNSISYANVVALSIRRIELFLDLDGCKWEIRYSKSHKTKNTNWNSELACMNGGRKVCVCVWRINQQRYPRCV